MDCGYIWLYMYLVNKIVNLYFTQRLIEVMRYSDLNRVLKKLNSA